MSRRLTVIRRDLTDTEEANVPYYFIDAHFSYKDNLYHVYWEAYTVTSTDGRFPWFIEELGRNLDRPDYRNAYPGFHQIEDINYLSLTGKYQNKDVAWSFNRSGWYYKNNREVNFEESQPRTPPELSNPQEEGPSNTQQEPSSPLTPQEEAQSTHSSSEK